MHSFGWDGKSFSGNNLPSGVYLYDVVATELNTGNQLYRATDKMILMK
jgi:flagellar hook assembly protein FlgD